MMSAFKCFSCRPRITACIRSSARHSVSSALCASAHTSSMRLRQSVMSFSKADKGEHRDAGESKKGMHIVSPKIKEEEDIQMENKWASMKHGAGKCSNLGESALV